MLTPSVSLFVALTRPDGTKLFLNSAQVIYIMQDIIGDANKRTEILTTQGSFLINKPISEVLAIISGEKKGEL